MGMRNVGSYSLLHFCVWFKWSRSTSNSWHCYFCLSLNCQNIPAILWLFSFVVKGHKEWLAEVQFLGIVNHPNLVKLLGYCSVDAERGIQRLLVYEFMPNRSLEDHLFNKKLPTLPWKTRLEIMLGAAQGLAYLHEGLEIQVPHRLILSTSWNEIVATYITN